MRPVMAYSPAYAVDYGGAPFSTAKFAVAAAAMRGVARVVEPREPTREDLLLAHEGEWVDRVLQGRLSEAERLALGIPVDPAVVRAHLLAVAGTVLAAKAALCDGLGLHCGGGSHHAYRGRGGGYCLFNDLAVAILKLRAEGHIHRAAVVDLDVHQGDGTASIFSADPQVFTFSMHQGDLYPEVKQESDLDVALRPGTGDEEYLELLKSGLQTVLDFKPDLVVYQAGVDVWEHDTLGGLKLTEFGILHRDAIVRDFCANRGIPIAVTLGGGYGPTPGDTGRIHARTLTAFAGVI